MKSLGKNVANAICYCNSMPLLLGLGDVQLLRIGQMLRRADRRACWGMPSGTAPGPIMLQPPCMLRIMAPGMLHGTGMVASCYHGARYAPPPARSGPPHGARQVASVAVAMVACSRSHGY